MALREIDRHLQDFAAFPGFSAGSILVGQDFARDSQSFNFFLQLQQFGLFAAEHFDRVLHHEQSILQAAVPKHHRSTGPVLSAVSVLNGTDAPLKS